MHCYQCGEQVLEEAVFCHRCGARLDVTNDSSPTSTSPNDPQNRHEETANAEHQGQSPQERFRDATANRNRNGGDAEHTLWEGGYSPKAMLGRWVFSALATLASIAAGIWLSNGYVWLGIGVFILLLWAYQCIVLLGRRWSVRYRLTNQRFIHETGIMRRVTDRIELIDVDDITFEQGMIDRLVGVGLIRISSSDRTHPELTLPGIEDVAQVAGLLDETYRAERRRRGLFVENI